MDAMDLDRRGVVADDFVVVIGEALA